MADYLTIAHEVADFDAWKAVYDADAPRRRAAGLTDLLRLRETQKPHLISLLFAVEDPDRALAMARSPDLAETMRAAGVIGVPFATVRTGDFTPMAATTYLTMNLKVSDIGAFRTGYAAGAAAREAAGLTDLGLLRKPEDPNDLFLIWSVGEAAKAERFLASPEPAGRWAGGAGVAGPPVRHFWKPA